MIVIKFKNGTVATVENWQWLSSNKAVEGLLNRMRPEFGPPGWSHYPDLYLAEIAVEKLGAEIISKEEFPEIDKGKVY